MNFTSPHGVLPYPFGFSMNQIRRPIRSGVIIGDKLSYFVKVITTFDVFPTLLPPTLILKYPPLSEFLVGCSVEPMIFVKLPDVEVI